MTDWALQAKRILRSEMVRRSISYKELADRLSAAGASDASEKTLRTKLARGTFGAAFFLEVLAALGATSIHLEPPEGG